MNKDCLVSIQEFERDGSPVQCPIYFDIDRDDLLDAYEDTVQLVRDIKHELDISPVVFFSGSKGFHVLIPYMIVHGRCNEIARVIASKFSRNIDTSIYRNKGLIRVVNTVNTKSGLYKINVTEIIGLGLDLILRCASKPSVSKKINFISSDELDEHVKIAVDNLPSHTRPESYPPIAANLFEEMPPCISKLWNVDKLSVGTIHNSIYILVNFMYRRGIAQAELLNLFSSHASYKTADDKYIKIINSIYRNGSTADVGCVSGIHAEFLRDRCDSPCWFKNKYKDFIRGTNE